MMKMRLILFTLLICISLKSKGQCESMIIHFYSERFEKKLDYKIHLIQDSASSNTKCLSNDFAKFNSEIKFNKEKFDEIHLSISDNDMNNYFHATPEMKNYVSFSITNTENSVLEFYSFQLSRNNKTLFNVLYELESENNNSFKKEILHITNLEKEYNKWVNEFNSCTQIVLDFNFEKRKDLNVHESLISTKYGVIDTMMFYDSLIFFSANINFWSRDTNCNNSLVLWNLPFFTRMNTKTLDILDSSLFNKLIPQIFEDNKLFKNQSYLIAEVYHQYDSVNYKRYVSFGDNYSNILEFAYLLEKIEKLCNPYSSCVEWILMYLSWGEKMEEEDAQQLYESWKKENKKD